MLYEVITEHTIDGTRYDLVAHMVHQNPETKQLAVIAVFFKAGKNNPVLDNILGSVGREARIDPQDLLPGDTRHYFHYIGSLTTPPCSEDVQWYLLKTPVEASKEQIAAFRKYYVDNERPVQELFDRSIEANVITSYSIHYTKLYEPRNSRFSPTFSSCSTSTRARSSPSPKRITSSVSTISRHWCTVITSYSIHYTKLYD